MRIGLRRTPATAFLLAAIAGGFLLEMWAGGTTDVQVSMRLGANQAAAVWQGQWWRLLASMFLHDGILHLAFNGWALYQLGSLFEIWLGSSRLLATYFASGIAGSLASVLWNTYGGGELNRPSVGASGAIFGLLGALIAFLLRRRSRLTPLAKSLLGQLLFWAGINLVLGITFPLIDNAAHMGGLVAGLAAGLLLRDQSERQPRPAPAIPSYPPDERV
ncbi:MAG TPA: rhomboid family intramembrane serine protease [Thermoanaerobaculia bacterium]|jgi:rhomboid protease GluP